MRGHGKERERETKEGIDMTEMWPNAGQAEGSILGGWMRRSFEYSGRYREGDVKVVVEISVLDIQVSHG